MIRITQAQDHNGSDWWEWSAWLEGPPGQMERVEGVDWHLHPTFSPRVVEARDRDTGFRVTRAGWGSFTVRAELLLTGGGRRTLRHEMELLHPDGTATER